MPDKQIESEYTLTPEQQARRRLLKLGAYVPPAILGIAIMSQTGLAQASDDDDDDDDSSSGGGASCCPRACSPCTHGDGRNNLCRKARRKMGC